MKNLLPFLLFVSCAHSYHQAASDFSLNSKLNKGEVVKSKSEQFVIFGFTTNTNYVEKAYSELESQCQGVISPITTKYYTSLGFFSWTNKIELDGICLK